MTDKPIAIPRSLVEYILLGPVDDRRQLQDSPILGDVWIAFAADPGKRQDLLITPYRSKSAGYVAGWISRRMRHLKLMPDSLQEMPDIAYLQGVIAAHLDFVTVMQVLLPVTSWWFKRAMEKRFSDGLDLDEIKGIVARTLRAPSDRQEGSDPGWTPDSADRYIALSGLIQWAVRTPANGNRLAGGVQSLADLKPSDRDAIVDEVHLLLGMIVKNLPEPEERWEGEPLIFQVSLNRRAWAALDKSVPAVKADAARTLFSVRCDEITWAILDSGIDGTHEAFRGASGARIRRAFDFRNIRQIISLDNQDETTRRRRLEALRHENSMTAERADRALRQLAEDAENGRPIDWQQVEPFIRINPKTPPTGSHGTHVAGILAGRAVEEREGQTGGPAGMCPDINLYDFRILSRSAKDTEFAVIAALQYIRHLNGRSSFMAIHGVNLSLSIPHDVRNFACGRTPVCEECGRLVDNGVVVVAAAGNRGYQSFETKDGSVENYAAFSVTDPGNADDVITVGATHRYWPHTYGVSFFSSRGPTGDGRPKPDLVAPGERIRAPMPGGNWGELDGTSMAAPHVSGAAAMLMARYSELIGRPRRIKQILCDSATDLGREQSFQGRGLLDVLRAFQNI
jgi:hypothetical protein